MPSIGDKRWRKWTRPIGVFIKSEKYGRSWPELHVWRKENNLRKDMVRQLLAWLEYNQEITFDHTSKHWKGIGR